MYRNRRILIVALAAVLSLTTGAAGAAQAGTAKPAPGSLSSPPPTFLTLRLAGKMPLAALQELVPAVDVTDLPPNGGCPPNTCFLDVVFAINAPALGQPGLALVTLANGAQFSVPVTVSTVPTSSLPTLTQSEGLPPGVQLKAFAGLPTTYFKSCGVPSSPAQ